MECNRDEALRAKSIGERKLESKDFAGAKKFALKAQSLYPGLEGISHMVTTIDVYISAENKISGEVDWYGVLGVTPAADDDAIRKQYRKLALLLHPDKNRSVGADGAFKLICAAWSLLSDKSKRLAYNMRRGPKVFQPDVPSHVGGPSLASQANGYHNHKVKTPLAPKVQNNGARMFSNEGLRPSPRTDTFWTICHQCKMQYEYLKVYLNHTLLCPNCHEAFLATETAPPFNSKPSNSGSGHPHQNSSNSIPSRNFFDPRNATSSAKDSEPLPGFHSSSSGHVSQDRFSRTANVGNTDPSIAAKASNVVLQAHHKIKREREGEGDGLSDKIRRCDDGYHFGANNSNQWTGGNNISGLSGAALPRKVGFEFHAFPGFYSKPLSTRDLTAVETRNMLMKKARKEILKKLNEWKKQASSNAVDPGKPKVKGRKKENERSTQDDNGPVLNGFVESSANQVVDEARKSALIPDDNDDITELPAESMDVPDSDFHDFDLDRAESSFGDKEVWAAYDDDDSMPRYYAMVNKVITRKPFKLRISWLNSRTTNEFGSMDWIGSGFYKTCGEFRFGRYETYKSINSFSHKVKWSKVCGAVQIFPQRGDVWAVYKNWSPDWNEETPYALIHKYEMVIVLDDYSEEEGVSIIPLVKVARFKTVFLPNYDPEFVRQIPKEEMFRFSHQVPYYRLTDEEARNAPKGILELDPAATPLDLLQAVDECSGDVKEPVSVNETKSVETGEG